MLCNTDHRPATVEGLREGIVGIDTLVPLIDGTERRYVFLDNAASTPTFRRVLQCVEEFLPWYSGVHRGTGFKSQLATEVFDRAHDIVGRFVGADLRSNNVIFTKNTTEAVNKLARRFEFTPDDIVVCTSIEHHSNDLPWRKFARVMHVGTTPDGHVHLSQLRQILKQHAGKVRLVAVSGASNITGICPPVHEIAQWAHEAGAMIFVDAAQLVPHRPVAMLPDDDPGHLDFLAFSAHKIYAPFGTGVLIGPTEFFAKGDPDAVGGGVARIVTLDSVEWNPPPHKDEAGSPNVVGGVALAQALCILQSVGMDTIARHESALLAYMLDRMRSIDGLSFYGPVEEISDKVGVVAFNVNNMHPARVAAILSLEGGIGVRNGFFCAQPYVKTLLNIPMEDQQETGCGVVESEVSPAAGMVRASLGCYSNEEDVDALVEMLQRIVRREFKGEYVQHPMTGAFYVEGFQISMKKYFPFFDDLQPASERSYSESA
jgi:cysteine desulfurase/selenocysteine lyase